MASFLYTAVYMMVIFVASIHVYCSPIKRTPTATDQQATDCYGTDCFYSPDYFNTDTIVNVDFPENLTQVVLSILPLIPEKMEAHDQQIQNLTTVVAELLQMQLSVLNGLEKSNQVAANTLTQIATTQNHTSNVLTQMASTQTQMADSFSQVVNLLQMQKLENLTTAVTEQNQILLLPDFSRPAPRDCSDLASRGNYPSGPYRITPSNTFDVFVYCDMDTNGGGWTVFQRRFDGSVDFFLEWSDYETGFGNANGEYWAGLSLIHHMTQTGTWQLRIDLEAFDGDTAYAMYDSFSIGNALTNYQLSIGTYSGTAGDDLALIHNSIAFTTKDRDNDTWHSNCAQKYKGGWWYKSCLGSNLNALYLGPTGNGNTANLWYTFKNTRSLKKTEMKMRRVE